MAERIKFTNEEALEFHEVPTPGKISMSPTKPMVTQRDLSLAYSPGVAVPVLAIAEDIDKAYDYTSKGNLVAVISNGTAILGLGDLGPMASKPVMEGKSVLFKRFADIDSFDIEVDETDVDAFCKTVRAIGASFGGINLEDIASPAAFEIESRLKAELDIPVFHDDQHGTAIITAAGIINACEITGRQMSELKVAVSGAGAAGLSVVGLIHHLGVPKENIIMCDRDGVVYKGREGVDQFKSAYAVETTKRSLAEAVDGADCLIGLSVKGAVSKEMIASMADNPIIFVMANPDPEIAPEDIKAVRRDAIIATGRSDYPNQVNNVLGFPYIFRGALDVRAREINEPMKVAAAQALAKLAREDVPDEVAAAYHGTRLVFGREYIIPTPFDPRLLSNIPPFVAQAAMDTGVARRPIEDMGEYRKQLEQRNDPTASFFQNLQIRVREQQKRIVFAEGEEAAVVRAAMSFQSQGLGSSILIGREDRVKQTMRRMGVPEEGAPTIINAALSDRNPEYLDYLYNRLNRKGYLKRDVQRLVNNDRNVFGCCMLALGDADGMVTGVTRNYDVALKDAKLVLDPVDNGAILGMSMAIYRGRTIFIADTSVTELPGAEQLVAIAEGAANTVARLGFVPRVAMISYSTFGNPAGRRGEFVRKAVALLDEKSDVGFEYEGDIAVDVALNPRHHLQYPFSRLTGPANILIMPAIHSASISSKLLVSMSDANVVGPVLLGMEKPVQIASLGARVSDIVSLAMFAALDPERI